MRSRKDTKVELIRSAPVFSRCTKRELAVLAGEVDEVTVPSGKTLTRQGDIGREFVVIVDGAADVHKHGRRIARLKAGDFLGEIALFSGSARTATVTTTAESRLLVLSDRGFRRVVKRMPSVQTSVLKALSERLTSDAL